MMTMDKDHSVSVHVDDTTPVHVHVKKPIKAISSTVNARLENAKTRYTDTKVKSAVSFGESNRRRNARSRSKSPSRETWVPPPCKTTSKAGRNSFSAQYLDTSGPEDSTFTMAELESEDEEAVGNKLRHYERKIDSLSSEVGSLRGELNVQKALRRESEEKGKVSWQDLEHERSGSQIHVHRSTEQTLSEPVTSAHRHASVLTKVLLDKLVEVEMDSQAAVKQVAAMKDAVRRLHEERRISSHDGTLLNKQKELVMQRLSDFEIGSRSLRTIIRERHDQEASLIRAAEQRDMLLSRLADMEIEVRKFTSQLYAKDRLLTECHTQIDSQRQENAAVNNLQSSMEATRAHLQKQLRQKESDCNRMAVQIKAIENQLAQERIDADHLRQLLDDAREKAERDKEALKKAVRAQKNRATKSEDIVDHLNAQIMQHQTSLPAKRTEVGDLRSRCDKLTREKAQTAAENAGLKVRLSELENLLEQLEYDTKAKLESSTTRLQDKTSEASRHKLENERMKTTLGLVEDKLLQNESEMSQMRASLHQYENLVEEYRSQMNRTRRDADESMLQLDEAKREISRAKHDGEMALDEVKHKLQSRLQDLEPLPEMLRTTELRLHDSNEKMLSYERRNTENTKLIAELTAKVEQQSHQVENHREKLSSTRDENRGLNTKLETLEKKMKDMDSQNQELLKSLAKREESMHQSNMRLDEKSRECGSLSRQLESSLNEIRLQTELAHEKTSSKERAAQSRLIELESQLSQVRAEVARVKREKEEAERKFNSRLYDLKDRLEQSHSTNRSMQNYVQFLKSSYANVFGDTSMVLTSSPNR